MSYWVLRIIAANAVVYILTAAAPRLVSILMFVPALILMRPWTVITYMFVHGSFLHILFNMLALYIFGPRLEFELGSNRFLLLYFISGITGALLSLIMTPYAAIVGASGAVFGVSLGYAYFWPRDKVFIWGILPIETRWLVVLMTIISLYGGATGSEPGIAHFAHLGGFLGGFLYLRWLDSTSRRAKYLRQQAPPPARPDDMERWSNIDPSAMHPVNREEYERIRSKLAASGPESLSPEERAFLDRFSNP